MNRINQLFQEKQSGILSIYFCAGDPTPDSTLPTLQALQAAGIDLVEIGVPFSDPMADGPTIQSASTRSLRGGMNLRKLFDQLRHVRPAIHIPLILMGYLNVFYQYGFEHFCQSCQECGIDGAIIPDLPFDVYLKDYKPIADRYGLNIIMLITPETEEERIRLIDRHTNGFIYEVSTNATTGAQQSYDEQTLAYFKRIHDMQLRNPTLIGFGVSNRATLQAAQRYAAGAIVGSKYVKLAEQVSSPEQAIAHLLEELNK